EMVINQGLLVSQGVGGGPGGVVYLDGPYGVYNRGEIDVGGGGLAPEVGGAGGSIVMRATMGQVANDGELRARGAPGMRVGGGGGTVTLDGLVGVRNGGAIVLDGA